MMMAEPNDPTRSGPPVPDAGIAEVHLSQNEIVALTTKAARGAGMEWGLAEEAGFAAGWLSAKGVDGAQALLDHLSLAEGKSWSQICPVVTHGNWRASGGDPLCPVALGSTLCDFAGLPDGLSDGDGLVAGPVSQPVLLLPFLADIAVRQGRAVQISWGDSAVLIGEAGQIAGDITGLRDMAQASLHLAFGQNEGRWPVPDAQPPVCRDTMARLAALAMKTTVPATDASRDGAGAGTSDND